MEENLDLINKLSSNFSNYGNHDTREYELLMGDFCNKIEHFLNFKTKEKVYSFIKSYIKHHIKHDNIDKAYNGFYFMSVYSRRKMDYYIFEELMKTHKSIFKAYSTYSHIISVYYLTIGIPEDKYGEILSDGHLNYSQYKNHSGIIHCYADIVATIYENAIWEGNKIIDVIEDKYLKDALEAADLAILLNTGKKYAKFYSTKGRLLIISKEYISGKEFLNKAISYEKDKKSDNVTLYRNYIMKSDIMASFKETKNILKDGKDEYESLKNNINKLIDDNNTKLDKKMEQNLIKNIEILTFFTGLIGFLVSSISISVTSDNLKDAYSLIIIVFASFLAVFSLMDTIIKVKFESKWQMYIGNGIAFTIGIIVILLTY